MSRLWKLETLRQNVRIYRYGRRAFFWGPFLVGVASLLILSQIDQTREVYLGLLEGLYEGHVLSIFQAAAGLAMILFLCLVLHAWQSALGRAAVDRMYPEHADIPTDRRLLGLSDLASKISASLPLLGLILGLALTINKGTAAGQEFENILKYFGGVDWKTRFPEFETTTRVLPFYKTFGPYLVAALALLAGLVLFYGQSWSRWLLGRRMTTANRVIILAAVAIAVIACLLPPFAKVYTVTISRWLGPLAGVTIQIISLTAVLIGISILSHWRRWPIMGGLLSIGVVWSAVLLYGSISPEPPRAAAIASRSINNTAARESDLNQKFSGWLAARDVESWPADVEYPVFVIAAQGGGIYAAASTTAFLASMQDICPTFSQHVFVISAVSGGAVGSAIFNAIEAGQPLTKGACKTSDAVAGFGSLSEISKRIVRDDHLSPALAFIWPDMARKLGNLGYFDLNAAFDRSSALESSFACSLDPSKQGTGFCDASTGSRLRAKFKDHWKINETAPALVLTSTWVETGYRAAFAPFNLRGSSDGTLFTLPAGDQSDDFKLLGVDVEKRDTPSLIGAAMVSARFPGIVPAYVIRSRLTGTDSRPVRWNFVDGGYFDNSGATTAFEIYKSLHKHINSDPSFSGKKIRLYLILMTDAATSASLDDVGDGTGFSDTVAPLSAMLNVRGQLAGRAVTQAIDETPKLDNLVVKPETENLTGRDPVAGQRRSPVLLVNLTQKTFTLPLGWKISGTTDDIVRLMLGHPEFCAKEPGKGDKNFGIKKVISDNGCVKRTIIDLLNAPYR